MHESKIRNYRLCHIGEEFPEYRSLNADECATIRAKFGRQLGLPDDTDGSLLLQQLEHVAMLIPNENAERPDFNLSRIMTDLGVHPTSEMMLNWRIFDEIDKIKSADVCMYFSDIWYPSSDDLDIFDESYGWYLFIAHYGDIKFADFRNKGIRPKSSKFLEVEITQTPKYL